MGGNVSKDGELAQVKIDTSKVKVKCMSDLPILVRVFRRTSTRSAGAEVETLKGEFHLAPGEKVAGDNDFDITNAEKIGENNGLDYYIKIYPEDGAAGWEPETFQIVFDGTYKYFPDVKLLSSARSATSSAQTHTEAPSASASAASDTGRSGSAEILAARIRALGNEIRDTMERAHAEGLTQEETEELRLALIGQLQSAGEEGEQFFDCLTSEGDAAELRAKEEALDAQASARSHDRSRKSALIRQPDEWWHEADADSLGWAVTSLVMDSRIFHKPSRKPKAPWSVGQSADVYTEMGMCDAAKSYIAVWMVLGNAAILTTSEVVDIERLEDMLKDGEQSCLDRRLKLIIKPIVVSDTFSSILPASATDLDVAPFVKTFLGSSGSELHRSRTPSGGSRVVLMIDFNCAGMMISWALKKVGFREGHILDLHVVDGPGKALFASGRMRITKEVTRQM